MSSDGPQSAAACAARTVKQQHIASCILQRWPQKLDPSELQKRSSQGEQERSADFHLLQQYFVSVNQRCCATGGTWRPSRELPQCFRNHGCMYVWEQNKR